MFMQIDETLFCLGYFQTKYLLCNNLQPKMITSYSLLQALIPTNYANFFKCLLKPSLTLFDCWPVKYILASVLSSNIDVKSCTNPCVYKRHSYVQLIEHALRTHNGKLR